MDRWVERTNYLTMNVMEIQSFIFKFHQLWKAGVTAHLNLDTQAGKAWVGLRVELGQFDQVPAQTRSQRSPSYFRRQERRKAAKAADVTVADTVEENVVETSAVKADCSDHQEENRTNAAAEAVESLEAVQHKCKICDFKTNWKNSLSVHMTRKHSKIEQIDGNLDKDSDDELTSSRSYWKNGQIGTDYQAYLNICKIIKDSNLSEKEKSIENQRVLEAR